MRARKIPMILATGILSIVLPSCCAASAQQIPKPPCYSVPAIDGASNEMLCEQNGRWIVERNSRLPMRQRPISESISEQRLNELIATGNQNARTRQAVLILTGMNRQQDSESGARLMQAAASAGNKYAEFNMGVLHQRGDVGPQDIAKAILWYRKAADHGLDAAQTSLGYMYLEALGVPRDVNTAKRYFLLAADQGYVKAFRNLAVVHNRPKDLPQWYNPDQAVSWLKRALPSSPALFEYQICETQAQAASSVRDISISRASKIYIWCSLARIDNESRNADSSTPDLAVVDLTTDRSRRSGQLAEAAKLEFLKSPNAMMSFLEVDNLLRQCIARGPLQCGL